MSSWHCFVDKSDRFSLFGTRMKSINHNAVCFVQFLQGNKGFGCSWKRIKISDLQNLKRGLIIFVFNYRTRIWSSFSFWIWVGTKKPYSRPKQGKILKLENKRASPWWWLFASQIKTTTIRVNGNGIWV